MKLINQSISELAKAIEGVKPGAEQEIDYDKQKNIEAKTGGLIQRVLNVLPQAAETATTFTPLAPLSKLIGKGVQEIVNAIQRRKSAPSVCHPITNIPSAPNSTIDAGYFIIPNGYMDEGLVSVNAETKYQGIGVGEAADGPVHHIDIGDTLYPDVSTKSCLDNYHSKLNSEKYIECYRALE